LIPKFASEAPQTLANFGIGTLEHAQTSVRIATWNVNSIKQRLDSAVTWLAERKPDIVCLVPERRQELTTEGGLDVVGSLAGLTEARHRLSDAGIEVSLFIAPDPAQIDAAARVGSQFVELHTGAFAEEFSESRGLGADQPADVEARPAESTEPRRRELAPSLQLGLELERLVSGAQRAHKLGLRVNAGHGLNYRNLPALFNVPHLVELNIGHSIISRAVSVGLNSAVKEMLAMMTDYDSGRGH